MSILKVGSSLPVKWKNSIIDLHWLPVKQRIEFKLLTFVFKSLHGSAPSYLSELLLVYISGRTGLCFANLHLLQEPGSNNSFGDRSFAICAPKLWNHLPLTLRTVVLYLPLRQN